MVAFLTLLPLLPLDDAEAERFKPVSAAVVSRVEGPCESMSVSAGGVVVKRDAAETPTAEALPPVFRPRSGGLSLLVRTVGGRDFPGFRVRDAGGRTLPSGCLSLVKTDAAGKPPEWYSWLHIPDPGPAEVASVDVYGPTFGYGKSLEKKLKPGEEPPPSGAMVMGLGGSTDASGPVGTTWLQYIRYPGEGPAAFLTPPEAATLPEDAEKPTGEQTAIRFDLRGASGTRPRVARLRCETHGARTEVWTLPPAAVPPLSKSLTLQMRVNRPIGAVTRVAMEDARCEVLPLEGLTPPAE